ncbi:LamG-like jellyroll fold domain-containing protein [Promicromonospora kroppenstedtii]|uniref:LamG-like jellyroll fold domain-containing protein n=1 Tax=Promicromonospora kroppenstedtii TaxID=440482 RepID=UPI0004BA7C29|nr:LamG-like jellyroll fold domain-containing protein [Promicromonospora kroppenstedtii]
MAVRLGAGGSDLVAGVVAIALAAGGTLAVEAVRAEGNVVADCSASSARTEVLAFELAEACGKDIEIEPLRTVYDTFWATPRQTVRAEASSGAVRTDLEGSWQTTDPSLSLDESGIPQVAAPVYDMDLAGDVTGSGPFMTMRSDGLALSMGLPDGLGLGSPELDQADESRVIYPVQTSGGQEIEGADLILTIHPDATGFTPVLRVENAGAGEALVEAAGEDGLGFVVDVAGGLALTDEAPTDPNMAPDPVPEDGTPDGAWEEPSSAARSTDASRLDGEAAIAAADEADAVEGFYAVDPTGTLTFTGAPAWQWDSEIDPVVAARSQDATQELAVVDDGVATNAAELDPADVAEVGDDAVALETVIADDGRSAVIRADHEMVTDQHGSFPVFVDPAVSGSRHSWTSIKEAWPTSTAGWKFTGSSGVGYCNVNLDLVCQRSGVQRLIWRFTGMSFVGALTSADVVSASFRAYGTHSYNCTKTTMQLYRTPSINSSTNWSNQASRWDSSYLLSSTSDAYYSSACGGPHWTEWDATEAAKVIALNGWDGIHLGLKGTSTSDMATWKKLRYDARFSVEYNRAPLMPSGHQTLVDAVNVGCSTSASAPKTSRSLRPFFSAIGNDKDKQQVRMQFRVLTAADNKQVWESDWSTWQSPGTAGVRLSKRVTEGNELATGTTYWWQARIQDASNAITGYADSKHCYFRVDITAPAEPVITPLRDHPDAQAYYETDKERGGVGLKGCFEVYAPSTDSTTIWWGYETRTNLEKVVLDTTRRTEFCIAPGGAGPKFIYAKVADKAGLTSEADFDFDVAAAREDGVWTFDNADDRGEDTAVFDADRNEYLSAGQLSLSTTPVFSVGPHQEFGARDGDSALTARGSKIAWSEAPVIDTTKSFVVSAHVKLDTDTDPTAFYTALSQEAPLYNGFRLGYRPNSCPTSDGGCWMFGVNRELGANSPVYARSAVPVKFGQWVHLLGEYDKPEGKIRLYVCDAGTPEEPAVGEPILAESDMTSNQPASPGRFVVGRGFIDGSPAHYWNGPIDNVRIFRGEVLAQAKIRRLCQGAEASSYVGGNGVDDVDPTWGDDAGENEVDR